MKRCIEEWGEEEEQGDVGDAGLGDEEKGEEGLNGG